MGQSQVIVECAREACYGPVAGHCKVCPGGLLWASRGNPSGGSVVNYSYMATFAGASASIRRMWLKKCHRLSVTHAQWLATTSLRHLTLFICCGQQISMSQ